MSQEFKKNIEWTQGHKAYKVYAKKDKNGNTNLIGNLTPNIVVFIQKNTSDYAKPGEFIVKYVPVTYTKASNESTEDKTPEIDLGDGLI